MSDHTIHVSYCELPAEARALFTIVGLAAVARFVVRPPHRAKLDAMLSMVWDAERLTLNDLRDPDRLTHLIEDYLAASLMGAQRSIAIRQKPAA
jgi:hypothetical protein